MNTEKTYHIRSEYSAPLAQVTELTSASVLCASTGIDDLTVKDAQDWGWEE